MVLFLIYFPTYKHSTSHDALKCSEPTPPPLYLLMSSPSHTALMFGAFRNYAKQVVLLEGQCTKSLFFIVSNFFNNLFGPNSVVLCIYTFFLLYPGGIVVLGGSA